MTDQITIEISGKRNTYTAPTGWNDLTTAQLLHAYQIINAKIPSDPRDLVPLQEVGAKKVALLAALFSLNLPILMTFRRELMNEDPEHGADTYLQILAQLKKYTDPLFLEVPAPVKAQNLAPQQGPKITINPTLTKNPWPQLKHTVQTQDLASQDNAPQRTTKYFGPRDNFQNLTIYELGHIFTLFQNYCKSRRSKNKRETEHTTNVLLATIYRPPKPDTKENREKAYEGDIRLPLSGYEATIERRVKHMATLPTMVRKVLMFYVQSCLHSIAQEWESLFNKVDDAEAATNTPKSDFGQLIIKIAGGLTHIDKIESQPYENVFVYLDMLEKERIERELKQLQTSKRR